MSSFKDNTRQVLIEWCDKRGLADTLLLGRQMFIHPQFRKVLDTDSPIVQGTIAETIAYLQVKDFIKKNKLKDWGVHEGLIIKSTDIESNYLTEIDLLIYSPAVIFLLEVKSYGGTKKITKECTVERKSNTYDVYSQHSKHYIAFMDLFERLKVPSVSNSKACLPIVYFFSQGEIYDRREETYKKEMPVVTEENFLDLLSKYIGLDPVWEISLVREALKAMEQNKDKLTKSHLKYVKGLHGK